jgi:hypothetical protein
MADTARLRQLGAVLGLGLFAGAGLVALLDMAPGAEEPATAVGAAAPEYSVVTAPAAPVAEVLDTPAPPSVVDGEALANVVAAALGDPESAEWQTEEQLEAVLPPEIVRVLIDHEAVLRVQEDPAARAGR